MITTLIIQGRIVQVSLEPESDTEKQALAAIPEGVAIQVSRIEAHSLRKGGYVMATPAHRLAGLYHPGYMHPSEAEPCTLLVYDPDSQPEPEPDGPIITLRGTGEDKA